MPAITLRKAIYDELIRRDVDPTEYANEATKERLAEDHGVEVEI